MTFCEIIIFRDIVDINSAAAQQARSDEKKLLCCGSAVSAVVRRLCIHAGVDTDDIVDC